MEDGALYEKKLREKLDIVTSAVDKGGGYDWNVDPSKVTLAIGRMYMILEEMKKNFK